jgi:hypothetical protein
MLKRLLLLFFAIYLTNSMLSQQTMNQIEYNISIIRKNYPAYVRNKELAQKFEDYLAKKRTEKVTDTFRYVSQLINFFNDQHFQLWDRRFKEKIDSVQVVSNYKAMSVKMKRSAKSPFVGYWLNDYSNCIIGIVKNNTKPVSFSGFVVESHDNFLPLGTEILNFTHVNGNIYGCVFVDPVTGFKTYVNLKVLRDGLFTTNYYSKWSRLENYSFGKYLLQTLPKYDSEASFKIIDSSTSYIKIPVNSAKNARIIDSLTALFDSVIKKSKNLIIDIRNNRGGGLRTYRALLPYIYTSDIVRDDSYRYYSNTYAESYIQLRNRKISMNDTSNIYRIDNFIQKINENNGKFIYEAPDTIRYGNIMPYPKNVAVLVNYGCVSASEIMILDFIQSKKVKVFGEQTQGVADNLDAYFIETPYNNSLTIPSVIRVPGNKKYLLDGVGFTPDVILTEIVKDWIEFVKKYYEN